MDRLETVLGSTAKCNENLV